MAKIKGKIAHAQALKA